LRAVPGRRWDPFGLPQVEGRRVVGGKYGFEGWCRVPGAHLPVSYSS